MYSGTIEYSCHLFLGLYQDKVGDGTLFMSTGRMRSTFHARPPGTQAAAKTTGTWVRLFYGYRRTPRERPLDTVKQGRASALNLFEVG